MRSGLSGGLGLLCGVLMAGCSGAPVRPEAALLVAVQPVARLEPATLKCFTGPVTASSEERPWAVALLSPRMVYSLLGWPRMQREAEALGFQVQAWRDPRVPAAEWRAALGAEMLSDWRTISLETLPAECLAHWLPIDHLPLARVVWREQVHMWPIWGVMPPDAWRATLLNRLQTLQGTVVPADPR